MCLLRFYCFSEHLEADLPWAIFCLTVDASCHVLERTTTMAIILGTLCSNGVPLASFEKYSYLAPLPPCTMLKLGFETGD